MSNHSPRAAHACWLLALLLLLGLSCSDARMMRKVHATIPYTIEGRQTVVGPDGKQGSWGVGGQVLLFFTLRDAKSGNRVGTMAGHCHIVAPGQAAGSYTAVCTKHLDWADGSTMTAHVTETLGPDNRPVAARMVIAGGIGQWEGAHGEDTAYRFDPAKGSGSGTIVLTCLKGVC